MDPAALSHAAPRIIPSVPHLAQPLRPTGAERSAYGRTRSIIRGRFQQRQHAWIVLVFLLQLGLPLVDICAIALDLVGQEFLARLVIGLLVGEMHAFVALIEE